MLEGVSDHVRLTVAVCVDVGLTVHDCVALGDAEMLTLAVEVRENGITDCDELAVMVTVSETVLQVEMVAERHRLGVGDREPHALADELAVAHEAVAHAVPV